LINFSADVRIEAGSLNQSSLWIETTFKNSLAPELDVEDRWDQV